MTLATILIPAHNEEAVIARTLGHLSRGLAPGVFRVVVIANACTDATASRARAAMPQATVIETDRPGKSHALNLGRLAVLDDAPVICLDADLDVTAESLCALVAPLRDGAALAACGRMDVTTSDASAFVRAFYEGWRSNPYFSRGKFGGLFALSAEGTARVFPLPEVTADDEYVRRSFSADEIAFVADCRFVARAPRTLTSLVRVRCRSLRGAQSITRMGKPSPERGSGGTMLRHAVRQPSNAVPIAVFAAVTALVRLLLALEGRGTDQRWERDLTTRMHG